MFGNRLGWLFSAVIVFCTVLILVYAMPTEVSAPTQFGRNAPQYTIALPVDPTALIPLSEPGDSTALYQQALEDYQSRPEQYDAVTSLQEAQQVQKGLDLLLQAGRAGSGGVFASNLNQVINYTVERPHLEAIQSLGTLLLKVGKLSEKAGNLEAARKHYEALFGLGTKLYLERLTYWELDAGLAQLGSAAYALTALAQQQGDLPRHNRFKNFDEQRRQYYEQNIKFVRNGVLALDPHTGDMIALAENAGDPMWKIDAILALGRCKFSAARGPDQRGALRELTILSASADPKIKTAAQAALDLQIEEFRKLR